VLLSTTVAVRAIIAQIRDVANQSQQESVDRAQVGKGPEGRSGRTGEGYRLEPEGTLLRCERVVFVL